VGSFQKAVRPMDLQLVGKVAIVTGASRGIGRAIALTLATEGMRVVLVARSRDRLDQVAASCETESLVHEVDLRQPDAPAAVVASTMARFGQIDVLVNNAGATRRGDFLHLPDVDWTDGFALKFFGAMRCCRAAWPHLITSRGAVVNVVGIGGRTATAEFTIGGAVNAALLNLTKALADRGQKEGVRVNAVNPGAVSTERLQARVQSYAREQGMEESIASDRMAQALGVTRFGTPDEIARVVAFLASPQSSYCQGTIVDVDGGQTRTL
jgi:NAD(P)-dependent dehydrogenase (short-subunit alcohol dehydrogenase family)